MRNGIRLNFYYAGFGLLLFGGIFTVLSPSIIDIAFCGQKCAQTPHPIQRSSILRAFLSSFK
jgi:hypothetical protein